MSPDILFIAPQQSYPKRHKSAYFMAVVFVMIVASGYILFRSSAFFSGPDLTLEEPADGALLNGGALEIKGRTESKTRVTINGYEVFSDALGKFEVSLPIQKGYHLLDVRVKNRLGKESRVVRRVVVE